MLEKIADKIEEIRRQPEQVRMRWVWICVSVSMFIIITIWIFSISLMFQGDKKPAQQETTASPDITQQLQDLKKQAPSLQDYAQQPLSISSEGIGATTTQNDSQNIPQARTTDAPQTDAYSQLQNSDTSGQ